VITHFSLIFFIIYTNTYMSIIYSSDTDNSISAPAPTHFSPGLHYNNNSNYSNSSSNNSSQTELTNAFTVPNNFQMANLNEKAVTTPKSNSWFNTTAFRPNHKAIRRVASAPNANNIEQLSKTTPTTSSLQHLHDKESSEFQRQQQQQQQFDRMRLCRRTYSSASIKVKQLEVGPSSFVKVRMLGKGDVGKVYMVRQKGTDKLFAMKGNVHMYIVSIVITTSSQSYIL
jgi:hypothetical protein